MTNFKEKAINLADKLSESKLAKGITNAATVIGSGAVAVGASMMNSFAELSVTANASDILDTAEPFIQAGIPILLMVAGYKFGIRFLKGSTR